MSLYGIDVSYAQGAIDWEQVVEAKDFAIIRGGYGAGHVDARASYNLGECNRLNFPVGLYWFSYAYNVNMAALEGQYAADFAYNFNLQYPIYWDFEYDSEDYAESQGVTVTPQLFRSMANAFCESVEAEGYSSGLYYNPDFNSRYGIDQFFTSYPNRSKWIAKWGSTAPDDYNIWQYDVGNAGTVPGITTSIDLDIIDGDTPVPPTPPVPPVTGKKMPIWFYLRPF